MKHLYFDYAASTPINPEVLKTMMPYFSADFGNPGSLHFFGQAAVAAVDFSREILCNAIGAQLLQQVIFTSGATEANNLVLRGVVEKAFLMRPAVFRYSERLPHIITSVIEHDSILKTCKDLEKNGLARVTYVPVSDEGLVDVKDIENNLSDDTVLVSIIYANNEVGTIQPIAKIAGVIKDWKSKINAGKLVQGTKLNFYPLLHTDAVQALQFIDCSVARLGVDFLTLSGQKIYGPKGAGMLYMRDHESIKTIITGGTQEYGLRGGTLNVPAIVGFGTAVALIERDKKRAALRIANLADRLLKDIFKIVPVVRLNGSVKNRLPNFLNLCFPHARIGDLLMLLDRNGIAVSTGAACISRAAKQSHVLAAMGVSHHDAERSIRVTLGRPTTLRDIQKFVKIIEKLRDRL